VPSPPGKARPPPARAAPRRSWRIRTFKHYRVLVELKGNRRGQCPCLRSPQNDWSARGAPGGKIRNPAVPNADGCMHDWSQRLRTSALLRPNNRGTHDWRTGFQPAITLRRGFQWGRKPRRHSRGVCPVRRRNTRPKRTAVPKPAPADPRRGLAPAQRGRAGLGESVAARPGETAPFPAEMREFPGAE
jgi:hypothetical protein